MTLENVGVANAYRRPYVLAVYACHRLHAGSVVVDLWAKLLEICSMLERPDTAFIACRVAPGTKGHRFGGTLLTMLPGAPAAPGTLISTLCGMKGSSS